MKTRTLVALAGGIVLGGAAGATASLTGFTYTQDFDSLPNAGTNPLVWANNTTLVGWYARRNPAAGVENTTQIRHDTGTLNTGSIYSYGAAGSTERALGSISSGTPNTQNWGLALTNNTGAVITEFTLSYTGEQWRDGGGATAVPNTLDLGYQIVGAASFSSASFDGGFTDLLGAFDFTGPVNGNPASGVALDGNAAPNRVTGRGGVVSGLSWQVGEVLVLRWQDINDVGNDHGVAIDDLTITFVPTPGASALVAIGLATVSVRRRRA